MARQIATAAVDVLRSEHMVLDPVTGVYVPSTLLEGARTNGWTFSEQLDNAAWTKTNVTVSANATTAPDDTATADKIVETATLAEHIVQRVPPAMTDNVSQTFSAFLKAGERTWAMLLTIDKAGGIERTWINLATGALGVQTGTGAARHTVRIDVLGNGWYRVAVTFTAASGATTTSGRIYVAPTDGPTGANYTGDGVSGIYAWGLQFEADATVGSSYIKTEAATATRSADSFYYPFNLAPQEMTLYARVIEQGTGLLSGSLRVLQIGGPAGSTTPRLLLYSNATTTGYTALHHNGAASVNVGQTTLPARGDRVELALRLYADGSIELLQSINGAAVQTIARTAANALAAAWAGAGDTRLWVNGGNATTGVGLNAFIPNAHGELVTWRRGVKSMTQMRAAFGG